MTDWTQLVSGDALETIAKERLWIRWPIYWVAIIVILLCGMWGSGYNANSFIYYQF